jgi:hypothetical protein
LVDNAIRENASHVVFQKGVNDTIYGHDAPDHDKYLPAGESPYQGIDCGPSG